MFDSFRDEGWNTYYAPQRHAAAHHVLHYIIGYFGMVAAIALTILVLSSRGKERWGPLLRLIFNLHTAVVILFCVTGQDWLSAEVRTRCQYSPGMSDVLQADIGLHIGLKGINITLIADTNSSHDFHDIYYNEEFSLFASDGMETGLQAALHRGLPYPLLYVVEYFGVDAGGLRWSRVLRLTGHFSYIMLWTALVMWVLSQLLLSFVISRAAILNLVSGIFMLMTLLFYHVIQPETPLVIPFQDGFLRLTYGWCFWLTGASGLMTLLYSIALLLLHRYLPEWTSEVILCEVVNNELYDRIKPEHEGVLQINTPYHERKMKNVERFKSAYDNSAFDGDERRPSYFDRHNNRRCSVVHPPTDDSVCADSPTAFDMELMSKRTMSSPAILEDIHSDEERSDAESLSPVDTGHNVHGGRSTDHNVHSASSRSSESRSWEISPDYSSLSEDDDDIIMMSSTAPSSVKEVNECKPVNRGSKKKHSSKNEIVSHCRPESFSQFLGDEITQGTYGCRVLQI